MGFRDLMADLVLDTMYRWKKTARGRVAHMVPKRNTGLSLISHCGLGGPWTDAPGGMTRCVRCEARHASLTHDAAARGRRGGPVH